jgi:hypothetical protein
MKKISAEWVEKAEGDPGFGTTKRDMKKALLVVKKLRPLMRDFFGLTVEKNQNPGSKRGVPGRGRTQ